MATYEVSTWAQLKSAIASAAGGDTIKLITDIDCNNEIPEGTSSLVTARITGLTIDGSYQEGNVTKNHVIRNLRTSMSSPQAIFNWNFETSSTTKTFNIKNIDFINLILDAPLVAHYSNGSGTNQTIFRNCRFTGKRTDYLYSPSWNNTGNQYAYFYSCYFNMPYYGTSYTKSPLCAFDDDDYHPIRSYAHYCRFKETYTGTWAPSTTTEVVCCSVSNTWLNGCRVEGTIVNGYSVYFHKSYIVNNLGTPPMQNVYDVNFKLTDNNSENVVIQALKGVVKIPVRKYSDDTPYGVGSYSTGTIPATESQMQDTTWLIQHNFDVVPSDA